MNAPVKLGVFAVGLVAVFGAGAGLGAAIGPDATDDAGDVGAAAHDHSQGYAFQAETRELGRGTQQLRFRITDPAGLVVTDYEVEHEKELHLIVASTDLVSFEHVHPVRDAAGWWSVDLHGLQPGAYRAYADFAVKDGPSLVLEHDLVVPGEPVVRDLPAPALSTTVDGLEVELEGHDVAVGESAVTLRVSRDGRPVELEPYLGAGGHLVAINVADLSYLHVHPTGDDVAHGEVEFALAIPESGPHRLFFDFQVDGVVHTAAFTVDVRDGEPAEQPQHGH